MRHASRLVGTKPQLHPWNYSGRGTMRRTHLVTRQTQRRETMIMVDFLIHSPDRYDFTFFTCTTLHFDSFLQQKIQSLFLVSTSLYSSIIGDTSHHEDKYIVQQYAPHQTTSHSTASHTKTIPSHSTPHHSVLVGATPHHQHVANTPPLPPTPRTRLMAL